MLIDWKRLALESYKKIKLELYNLEKKPCLWAILVWNNSSSLWYISQKEKWCDYVWMDFYLEKLSENTSQEELEKVVERFNNDEKITWFIVQLPLPENIDVKKIINKINPIKDVDWFHIENQWKIVIWDNSWSVACTPAWILQLINSVEKNLEWKVVTVIWKSNIVWKPIINLLINLWATVICCNSKTKNLENFTLNSDIIISATWKNWVLNKNMVKKWSIIIDVWFLVVDWKIIWDVKDTEEIDKMWCFITPVPGWVWPMTVVNLINNTLKIYKLWKI